MSCLLLLLSRMLTLMAAKAVTVEAVAAAVVRAAAEAAGVALLLALRHRPPRLPLTHLPAV